VPVEVRENLLDDLRISDAGDDLHRTSAVLTDLDVDLERALEAASSGHGAVLIRFCDSNGGPSRPFPLKVRRLNFTLERHSRRRTAARRL